MSIPTVFLNYNYIKGYPSAHTGCHFSSTNTNITITPKVIDRISIGLKRFEEEGHCYKMVKLNQEFVKN